MQLFSICFILVFLKIVWLLLNLKNIFSPPLSCGSHLVLQKSESLLLKRVALKSTVGTSSAYAK